MIRSSETTSGPPHPPGLPISPSGLNTARSGVRRIWQALTAGRGSGLGCAGARSAGATRPGRSAPMRAATAVMVEEFLTRGALVQSAAMRIDCDGGEPFQEGSGIIGPDCHEYEQMKAIFGSRVVGQVEFPGSPRTS